MICKCIIINFKYKYLYIQIPSEVLGMVEWVRQSKFLSSVWGAFVLVKEIESNQANTYRCIFICDRCFEEKSIMKGDREWLAWGDERAPC